VIHPFHPDHDREFLFLGSKGQAGKDRLVLQHEDGTSFTIPATWTDSVAPDPYVVVGEGRVHLRIPELATLCEIVGEHRLEGGSCPG